MGQRVLGGRYRLERPIGAGGMSVVWRAHDERLDRPVAVKLLSARYAGDAHCRAAIWFEARAAARLSHRHVASVLDYGESEFNQEPVPYLVTELLSGESLSDLLARQGRLSVRTALRVCAEVAEGLAAAHERGVVHRDVKPANVMLTATGAKVFDFGIAAVVGEKDVVGRHGWIMGTPSYLAPERLTGGPAVAATDVYGLALLMFRLLTGEQPRDTNDPYSRPPALPRLPGVPAEVAELYRRGVRSDPRRRPTAGEAAAVLRSALQFTSGPARISSPAMRTPALIAACLAVLAALILVVMNRPAGPASSPQEPAPVQTLEPVPPPR